MAGLALIVALPPPPNSRHDVTRFNVTPAAIQDNEPLSGGTPIGTAEAWSKFPLGASAFNVSLSIFLQEGAAAPLRSFDTATTRHQLHARRRDSLNTGVVPSKWLRAGPRALTRKRWASNQEALAHQFGENFDRAALAFEKRRDAAATWKTWLPLLQGLAALNKQTVCHDGAALVFLNMADSPIAGGEGAFQTAEQLEELMGRIKEDAVIQFDVAVLTDGHAKVKHSFSIVYFPTDGKVKVLQQYLQRATMKTYLERFPGSGYGMYSGPKLQEWSSFFNDFKGLLRAGGPWKMHYKQMCGVTPVWEEPPNFLSPQPNYVGWRAATLAPDPASSELAKVLAKFGDGSTCPLDVHKCCELLTPEQSSPTRFMTSGPFKE